MMNNDVGTKDIDGEVQRDFKDDTKDIQDVLVKGHQQQDVLRCEEQDLVR